MPHRAATHAADSTAADASAMHRELLDIRQSMAVLNGQVQVLDKLEAEIRGWKEWTEELDGHWSTQRRAILTKMTVLTSRAGELDMWGAASGQAEIQLAKP